MWMNERETLEENAEQARLIENIRGLAGEELWKMAVEVLGEDRIADAIADCLASRESYLITEAAKRAGVKL